jgi:Protein of unknown function (DUF732)
MEALGITFDSQTRALGTAHEICNDLAQGYTKPNIVTALQSQLRLRQRRCLRLPESVDRVLLPAISMRMVSMIDARLLTAAGADAVVAAAIHAYCP